MSPRYRDKPFVLVALRRKNATVWGYYTYDKDGKRTSTISTGYGFSRERDRKKSRREAEAYLWELHKHGRLGSRKNAPTLREWVERKRFWDYGKSDYVRQLLARSERDDKGNVIKPKITEGYADAAKSDTENHILPYHGDEYLDEITPAMCEELLFRWADEVSHKTANNRRSVYSSIMEEAKRLGEIGENPWDRVSGLSHGDNPHGAFAIEEVSRLLSEDGVDTGRDRLYYMAVKLAFMTGMRLGEVCGLTTDDVRDVELERDGVTIRASYLDIRHQYHKTLKRRTQVKDKEVRQVPIAAEVRDELEPYMTGPGRYLFSFHPRQLTPLTQNRLRDWLYARMESLGISRTDSAGRKKTFHSTRRFFNTLLRHNRVADDVIRRFTGHDSAQMTEHYTDYLAEDLQMISDAQRKLTQPD